MSSFFISYRREKRSYADQLVEVIQESSRDYSAWHDKQQRGGKPWWDEVLQEIDACSVFVPLYDAEYDHSYTCAVSYTHLTLPTKA